MSLVLQRPICKVLKSLRIRTVTLQCFSYIHTVLLRCCYTNPRPCFSPDLYNIMFGPTHIKWITFPTSAELHRSCSIGHVVWRHTHALGQSHVCPLTRSFSRKTLNTTRCIQRPVYRRTNAPRPAETRDLCGWNTE